MRPRINIATGFAVAVLCLILAQFVIPRAEASEGEQELSPEEKELFSELEKLPPIRAISPPFTKLERQKNKFYWLGIPLLALSILLLYLRSHRNAPKLATQLNSPLTPSAKTRRELEALLAKNLVERGEINAFYSQLSTIIRRYAAQLFDFKIMSCTTEELLLSSTFQSKLSQSHQRIMKSFLMVADLAKFADYRPAREEIDREIASLIALLEETELKEDPDEV